MIENELSTHASSPTEGAPAPVSMGVPGGGAGAILRSYRESAGIHIVALASALKVTRAKLEALESDRYEELPDVVFARALAMSCCRYLGQDPESVLARMPSHDAQPAPGLRQHQLGNGMTPRPSFGPSRGPFASSKVPSWAIWALVLAAIVMGVGLPLRPKGCRCVLRHRRWIFRHRGLMCCRGRPVWSRQRLPLVVQPLRMVWSLRRLQCLRSRWFRHLCR